VNAPPGDRCGADEAPLPVEWLASVSSTQVELTGRARMGAGEQALVTTSQTAGHGRRGRDWVCPPGVGLAMSVLLRPARTDGWTWLPLLAGLATVGGLEQLGASGLSLKWPNDLLWADEKLGGLIAERVEATSSASGAAFVVGIGLNLRSEGLPTGAVGADRAGVRMSAEAVSWQVLSHLRMWVDRWEDGGDGIAEAYRARCDTLGRRVRVALPGGAELKGWAADIDQTGRLVVHSDHGAHVPLSAGEVVHVRRA